MERFVVSNQIESFEQLREFKEQREPDYEKQSVERQKLAGQIAGLEQLLIAYSEYEPYIVYHKTEIGNTTYRVRVHFPQNTKRTFTDSVNTLIMNECICKKK